MVTSSGLFSGDDGCRLSARDRLEWFENDQVEGAIIKREARSISCFLIETGNI